MESVRMELRRMGKYEREVPVIGLHSAGCMRSEDGIVCDADCTIVDQPVMPTTTTHNNHLIDVLREAERPRWFKKVVWSITRIGSTETYTNGRCAPDQAHEREDVWYQGKTWTLRGAEKAMNKAIGTDEMPPMPPVRQLLPLTDVMSTREVEQPSIARSGFDHTSDYDLPVEEIEELMDLEDAGEFQPGEFNE